MAGTIAVNVTHVMVSSNRPETGAQIRSLPAVVVRGKCGKRAAFSKAVSLEGVDLGTGLRPIFFGEEDAVILAGVEGRVEVDEVDGFVADVETENIVVVSVVKPVLLGHGRRVRVARGDEARVGLSAACIPYVIRRPGPGRSKLFWPVALRAISHVSEARH